MVHVNVRDYRNTSQGVSIQLLRALDAHSAKRVRHYVDAGGAGPGLKASMWKETSHVLPGFSLLGVCPVTWIAPRDV